MYREDATEMTASVIVGQKTLVRNEISLPETRKAPEGRGFITNEYDTADVA